ncbi:amino acid permease [Streptococcaceae bacterium ESL0729]|nr:amino acid permease [Streptococcaceae bacterium ESL0729]
MIALGGTIGTGLFLGAGGSIQTAGPAIIIIYMITGLFMFWMMRALGELLLTDTNQPTFIAFIEKYLGKRAQFIMGWTYWIGWIVIAMAELTAIGIYMKYWFPSVPIWIWEIAFLIVLLGINVIAVGAFGEAEFWFSMIKVVAIVAMIVTGAVMVVAHTKTSAGYASLTNLWKYGFVADGGSNLLLAFKMVFFAFLGIEFVGTTAAEAKDPDQVIPKAINSIIIRILIFYVGALVAIMSIQPWTNYSANESPFVQVFAGIGITVAAGVINFVVLTAAASSLNSGIFATGRMLYSLTHKKANSPFAKLSRNNLPLNAILFSTLLIGSAAVVNVILPEGAFEIITSIASAGFIGIYMTLVYTHLKYRKSEDFKRGPQKFKMPGAPYTNYLTLAFLAGIFIILLSMKETRFAALLAIFWYSLMFVLSRKIKKD